VNRLLLENFQADLLCVTKQGEWLYDGTPFANRELHLLFHKAVHFLPDEGRYILRNERSESPFCYERTARFVLSLRVENHCLLIELADGRIETIAPKQFVVDENGSLLVSITEREIARFTRSAFQSIASYASGEASFTFGSCIVPVVPLSLEKVGG
jgi:hypothetical protein